MMNLMWILDYIIIMAIHGSNIQYELINNKSKEHKTIHLFLFIK